MPVSLEAGASALELTEGWLDRWTVTQRFGGAQESRSVRDLVQTSWVATAPVRGFSWRRGQGHRPGLQFLVSTGRHHGAESLEEARLLLALDFAGDLIDVVSQPFRLRFETAHGSRQHTPDFLAATRSGMWLIDVRPEALIKETDRESFAAAGEMALACGWHYVVAAGWREHVVSALDALSSQRRSLSDPLGLRPGLLASVTSAGVGFGELAAASGCEPVARAQLLHLLWHRRLGVNLAEPLGDRSLVVAGRSS
ncbi:TnsA-like heteromeric transposase endonuclease subunit [Nonomuraea turcica]|uniref:TnsA-like heteromeric transposase endonuclease subunit n=1 Tax=Nonomuraea sp. G32 TaxID=3067274 RepID=UPI00273B0503|nr:TnsA-like heteromeric transposase endonuclease subunit [Nonomuraea sp. G32]MDP4512113.1 TnsA-like heteromeric transposase endonuclease subunit [Nonomuraea sp. G32]